MASVVLSELLGTIKNRFKIGLNQIRSSEGKLSFENSNGANVGIEALTGTFTAPQGIPPFVVNSKSLVPNLNAELLNGKEESYYLNKYSGRLYVSLEGSDSNDGLSPSNAFRTIKAAARKAFVTPNIESIYVLSGDYYEDNPILLPPGTSVVGDNLRRTIIRPLKEGLDLFWVTSGCMLRDLVFRDNYGNGDPSKGEGVLNTGFVREIDAVTTVISLFPGNTIKRVKGVNKDASELLAFQKTSIVNEAYNKLGAFGSPHAGFVPPGGVEGINKCKRDLDYIIDAVVHDLKFGGNVKCVQAARAYLDAADTLQFINNELTQTLYTFDQARLLCREKILTVPQGFVSSSPPTLTVNPGLCASVQTNIDNLFGIIATILQGNEGPEINPGPGYVLIDQEWCEVRDFDPTTNILSLVRGINDPVTGTPTIASRHISGAVVSQGAIAHRYAVAFPDQEGIKGRGRVVLTAGSETVNGAGTRFLDDYYGGGFIKIGSNSYEVASVTSNTVLTLKLAPTTSVASSPYRVIPKQATIYLSPYVQNCSNISVLGKSFYNVVTKEYDPTRTRAGGMLIDGGQISPVSPLRSMVADAFTQVVFGSIGFHHKRDGYAQLVSVFQVFEDVGILAESGGYASVTNSATNFGREGLKAIGYSARALPFFANGRISSITNSTKVVENTSESSILSSSFSSANNGLSVRVRLTVPTTEINKFEKGQQITIEGHDSVLDINGTALLDLVDYAGGAIEFLAGVLWSNGFLAGGNTGTVKVTSGAVFTELTVTGFTVTPPSNYIAKIQGLPAHPSGEQYVVADILQPLSAGSTRFSLNLKIPDNNVTALNNTLNNNAQIPVELRAPSSINSSGHTFEYVGAGINYTALPENGGAAVESKQNVEIDSGKSFTSGTDQDGNFIVGPYFAVNLRTGKVKFTGQVSIGTLEALELKASPGVPVYRFSADTELGGPTGKKDTTLSTQKAVRDFITNKLGPLFNLNAGTSGGSPAYQGQLVQLDSSGRISPSQLPVISPINVYVVPNQAARLVNSINGTLLKAGDLVIQQSPAPATTFVLSTTNNGGGTNSSNWFALASSQLDASAISSGVLPPARLAFSGTANENTFLNGLSQYKPIARGVRSASRALNVSSDGELIYLKIGAPSTISSASWSGSTELVTLVVDNTLTAGDSFVIENTNPSSYNGTYLAVAVTPTTVSYRSSNNPGTHIFGGTVTKVYAYATGLVDISAEAVSFPANATSSTVSSLGVSRFLFSDFNIGEGGTVSVKEKSIALSKIQDIAATTVLGNTRNSSGGIQEIPITALISPIPLLTFSVVSGQYAVADSTGSLGVKPTLAFVRGQTYKLSVNVTGQPLYITTSPGVTGTPPAGQYTIGIRNSSGAVHTGSLVTGEYTFTVPFTAPDTLYYQSGTSADNYGEIAVLRATGDATTSRAGLIAIATQAEVNAGTVSTKAVVPSTLTALLNSSINTAVGLLAPKDSPTFTGTVTVPNPASASNTNVAATTAWVRSYVAGGAGGSVGSVSSVGLTTTVPFLNVSNTPITSAGDIKLELASQNASTVLAGPISGAAGAPSFRPLVKEDFGTSLLPQFGGVGLGVPVISMGGLAGGGTLSLVVGGSEATKVLTVTPSAGQLTLNFSLASYFKTTINSTTTVVFPPLFSGGTAPLAGYVYSFTLEVTLAGGGLTWPSSVRWPKSTAPSGLIDNRKYLFMFSTTDQGTTWQGAFLTEYAL